MLLFDRPVPKLPGKNQTRAEVTAEEPDPCRSFALPAHRSGVARWILSSSPLILAMQPQVTPRSLAPRRERQLQIAPEGPPWKLVSPFGVLHIMHDRRGLQNFMTDEKLDTSNVEHLLGLNGGNCVRPQHVQFWQPLHLLLFLKHEGSDELVPVLGAALSSSDDEEGGDLHLPRELLAEQRQPHFETPRVEQIWPCVAPSRTVLMSESGGSRPSAVPLVCVLYYFVFFLCDAAS